LAFIDPFILDFSDTIPQSCEALDQQVIAVSGIYQSLENAFTKGGINKAKEISVIVNEDTSLEKVFFFPKRDKGLLTCWLRNIQHGMLILFSYFQQ
jgi:hypothetical protein